MLVLKLLGRSVSIADSTDSIDRVNIGRNNAENVHCVVALCIIVNTPWLAQLTIMSR